MPVTTARSDIASCEITAVLTKADGTVIDYGRVSYYNKNRFLHAVGNWWVSVRRAWIDFKYRRVL